MKLLRPATAAFALGCVCLLAGCPDEGDHERVVQTKDGPVAMRYSDLEVGKGEEVKKGDIVLVHYTGTLESGTKFASSHDRGKPLWAKLVPGKALIGWYEGIPGMKV